MVQPPRPLSHRPRPARRRWQIGFVLREPCERLIHHNPFSTKHLSLPDLRGELALFRTLAPSRNWLCLYVRTTGSGCLGRPLREFGFVSRLSPVGGLAPPKPDPNWVRFAHFCLRGASRSAQLGSFHTIGPPRPEAAGRRAGVPPQGCPQSAIRQLRRRRTPVARCRSGNPQSAIEELGSFVQLAPAEALRCPVTPEPPSDRELRTANRPL